jgi:hypothetical protein
MEASMTTHSATTETADPDFSPLSWPDDYLMNRKEASRLSKAMGLPVAAQTLAKLHCISSNGPPTLKFGRLVRLRVGEFKAWLIGRTSAPRKSTSDHNHTNGGDYGAREHPGLCRPSRTSAPASALPTISNGDAI